MPREPGDDPASTGGFPGDVQGIGGCSGEFRGLQRSQLPLHGCPFPAGSCPTRWCWPGTPTPVISADSRHVTGGAAEGQGRVQGTRGAAVSGTHSPLSGGHGPGETKLLLIRNWVMRPSELFVAPCGLGWPLLPLPRQDPSRRDPRAFCSAQIALICAWRIQVVS